MTASGLKLRSWPVVALAYVFAPLIGVSIWYGALTVPDALGGNFRPLGAIPVWFSLLAMGTAAGLIVELVIVTPILIRFHRRRWPWFTRWVGAGFGFLLGFAPQFIFGALNPSANPRQIPGSITLCTGGHCTTEIITPAPGGTTWEINGHWLLAGWAHVAADAVVMGSLGLATAVVFCVIAFRSAR